MNRHVGIGIAALLILAGVACSAQAQTKFENDFARFADPEIRREGAGEARVRLNRMEHKAFDASSLSNLSDWVNGAAPTADELKGKVVVITTWAGWINASTQLVSRLNAMQNEHGKDGLVVIAVHDGRRWEEMGKKFVADNGIKVLAAQDKDGKFRASMQIDQTPDIYVVDRAGNLRYADIETDSLSAAIEKLVAETPEVASKAPEAWLTKLRDERTNAGRTRDLAEVHTTQVKKTEVLNVPFAAPDVSEYEKAVWPKKNIEDNVQGAGNIQGSRFPVEFGKTETWLTPQPVWAGRVVVLVPWATWCGPCKAAHPTLEAIQRRLREDVAVVHLSGLREPRLTVQRYLTENPSELFEVYDNDEKILKQLGVNAIPHVFIMSTDGTVRWQGHPAQPDFQRVIDQIVNVDPGVKARRSAEQIYIRARGG